MNLCLIQIPSSAYEEFATLMARHGARLIFTGENFEGMMTYMLVPGDWEPS